MRSLSASYANVGANVHQVATIGLVAVGSPGYTRDESRRASEWSGITDS